MTTENDRPKEHQARRLRELMRNRFSQHVAENLIRDFGGELEALDFLLSETPDVVQQYLKEAPGYVEDIRKDSQNLESILKNGFDSSIRMFGCESCTKTWWKKVPLRKEVSKCRRCNVKYDPIPRDQEWGWGKFHCTCGNEFTSFAIMGETKSVCYKCDLACPVDHILPPRRRTPQKKSRTPHTCNGTNCYNRDNGDDYEHHHGNPGNSQDNVHAHTMAYTDFNEQFGAISLGNGNNQAGAPGAYPGPAPQPTCIHPKSLKPQQNRKLRWTSKKHRSTGSTVSIAMTQGSLDDATVASDIALCRIDEIKDM